jgi:hypothetical protein
MSTGGGFGLVRGAGADRAGGVVVVGVVVVGGVAAGDGGVMVTVVKIGVGLGELTVVVGRGVVATLLVVRGAVLRAVGVVLGAGAAALEGSVVTEREVTGSGNDRRSSLEAVTAALTSALIEADAIESGAAAGGAEFARELLPIVMTAPTSTPTVMLRADAVSAIPAPRRT